MRIVLIGFEGAQGLDLFGPAEVFAAANRSLGRVHYRLLFASPGKRVARTTSGIAVVSEPLARVEPRASDTVLVAGGEDRAIRAALASQALRRWLLRATKTVRRIGSVCSGAFVLANAGVLDGRRVATHWLACEALERFRPAVTVDRNAIFVVDGKFWTSAGVTSGIDMALALVEEDLGRRVADSAAARLVVYARRPGFQAQFSETLLAQSNAFDGLARAVELLRKSPARELDVSALAHAAGMSLRTLHRRCREDLGATPAKVIERLRTEHARLLISTTKLDAKVVAARSGFANSARMARAFQRTLGVRPSNYRVMFGREHGAQPAAPQSRSNP